MRATRPFQVCSRCVSDTTIPDIRFDANGVCQFCRMHEMMEHEYPLDGQGRQALQALVAQIKAGGRGRQYDCIVGVSGGRDSTFLLWQAKQLGLRPLAVHFDNGWNSDIAVSNIKNATRALGVDLYTHVADWEAFKDLQIAFLRAAVSDAEIPTDVALMGALYQTAAREGVRYIFNGHSFRTEGIAPKSWTYMDGRYVASVYRQFGGGRSMATVPNFTMRDLCYYVLIKRIQIVPLLNYFPYDPDQVQTLLERELGWKYYGGHHHESYYTYFFQSYYVYRKFGIDKRKNELSAAVRTGATTRDAALAFIRDHPYPHEPELVEYALSKLGLPADEFDRIMRAPNRTFHDFPTYYPLMQATRPLIKLAVKAGVLPQLLYLKFFEDA